MYDNIDMIKAKWFLLSSSLCNVKNDKMRPCKEEVKQKERKDNVGKYMSQPLRVYVCCNEFTLGH